MVRYKHTHGDPEVGPQMCRQTRHKPGPAAPVEAQEIRPCGQCLACVRVCPTGALQYHDRGWVLNLGRCFFCRECRAVCPNQLIREERE